MKLGKLAILIAILTAAFVSGWSSRGEAITLSGLQQLQLRLRR